MVKDGEDEQGLQMTHLKNLDKTFQVAEAVKYMYNSWTLLIKTWFVLNPLSF